MNSRMIRVARSGSESVISCDWVSNYDFNEYLDNSEYKSDKFTYKTLSNLQNAIHSKKILNYYLEEDQDIDKALNIFIRINSGGEPLNFSDLLMSIIVANWKLDARKLIYELVDEIRDLGFYISKDLIIRTFLVLHCDDVRFKVNNFATDNALLFENKWVHIRKALLETFKLIKTFGFLDSSLSSKNALIPIVYYIYHSNLYDGFASKVAYRDDREKVKKWLHLVLLKKTFGAAADFVLKQIRDVIAEAITDGVICFPADQIASKLKGTSKDLSLDDILIDNLLLTQKDHADAFSILAVLYPHLDYKNYDFHKDHLHPCSRFNREYVVSRGMDCDQSYNRLVP